MKILRPALRRQVTYRLEIYGGHRFHGIIEKAHTAGPHEIKWLEMPEDFRTHQIFTEIRSEVDHEIKLKEFAIHLGGGLEINNELVECDEQPPRLVDVKDV